MLKNTTLSIIATVIVCLLAAFLFLQPIFSNMGNWGLYDWDQHLFYHASPRISLLDFHEFPLWTPYHCGGNLLLANPQSPFLSPFFLFVLLFGAVAGLKLEALAYLAVGLFGMFLLARKLGCSRFASVFAAAVFMFSSWFAARVAVGHTTFFPFALLPLAFLFYLNAASASGLSAAVRWVIAAAVVVAVMFLSGGIYPFYAAVILLVLYSLLDSVGMRRATPLAAVAAILALAMLLSSVKLLPVVDFTFGVAAEKDVQLTSAGIVYKSLLSRGQSIPEKDIETGRDLVPEDQVEMRSTGPNRQLPIWGRQKELDTLAGKLPWRWHEYSAYVGIIPLLLAALSIIAFRRNWKLILAALFFLVIALGNYLPFGLWQLLRQLPFFSSLHGPSRFIIIFVFLVALLAAKALSAVKVFPNKKIQTAVVAVIIIAVTADLFFVSRPLLSNAFPLAPLEVKSTNIGTADFIQMGSSAPSLSQYPNLLQGIGTLNCYERLHFRNRAIPQFVDGEPYSGFVGNAYIAETNESLNFTHFSPQKISLRLSGIPKAEAALSSNVSELTLVINQNYYKGWKFDGSSKEAGSRRGLLAALIKKDDLGREVTFAFSSPPFILGSVISVLAVAAAALAFWKPNRAAAVVEPAARLLRKLESYVFRQS
ncbi:hypothetical protein HYU40_01990 [Candidatus Woesearchaeota archaeon]|nr:hypothetical protein [Candidatus Woesearchaeota archaeon]